MNSPKARKFRAIRQQYFQNFQLNKEQLRPKTRHTLKSTQSHGLSPWGQTSAGGSNLLKPATAQPYSSRKISRTSRSGNQSRSRNSYPQTSVTFHREYERLQEQLRASNCLLKPQSCIESLVNSDTTVYRVTPKEEGIYMNIRRRASLKNRMMEFFQKPIVGQTDMQDVSAIEDEGRRPVEIIKYPILIGQNNISAIRRQKEMRKALLTANRFLN